MTVIHRTNYFLATQRATETMGRKASCIADELENSWGVKYLLNEPKPARKSFGQFDELVKACVPGYQLHSIQSSGTDSNCVAVQLASNYDHSCCFYGIGSYIGGDQYNQELSTSMYDASSCISLPKYPENASPRCFEKTVPLPYHVPGAAADADVEDLEERCLRAFHKRLIARSLAGKRGCVLLLEYVLGGNGTNLSDRFLKKLAKVCKKNHCTVVADEILTGARAEGDWMCMTPSKPKEWIEIVEYITMGKFVNKALVLKKIPRKPTAGEKIRGTSTMEDCGGPYAIWDSVWKLRQAGAITTRKQEVVDALGLEKRRADVWGTGLLIFTSVKRPQSMQVRIQ